MLTISILSKNNFSYLLALVCIASISIYIPGKKLCVSLLGYTKLIFLPIEIKVFHLFLPCISLLQDNRNISISNKESNLLDIIKYNFNKSSFLLKVNCRPNKIYLLIKFLFFLAFFLRYFSLDIAKYIHAHRGRYINNKKKVIRNWIPILYREGNNVIGFYYKWLTNRTTWANE